MLPRTEDTNIKRLQDMGHMRWKLEGNDETLMTFNDKVILLVRTMAVEEKYTPMFIRLCPYMLNEVIKPGKCNVLVRISGK